MTRRQINARENLNGSLRSDYHHAFTRAFKRATQMGAESEKRSLYQRLEDLSTNFITSASSVDELSERSVEHWRTHGQQPERRSPDLHVILDSNTSCSRISSPLSRTPERRLNGNPSSRYVKPHRRRQWCVYSVADCIPPVLKVFALVFLTLSLVPFLTYA